MRKYYYIGMVLLLFFSSCRFSSPLIKFNKISEDVEFSIEDRKELSQFDESLSKIARQNCISYHYFRISSYGIYGGYHIFKLYNDSNKIDRIEYVKTKVYGMFDGTQRTKKRTVYFQNGKIIQIDYKITQAYGIAGWSVMDKTKIYHTDGTVEKINRKDKNDIRYTKKR